MLLQFHQLMIKKQKQKKKNTQKKLNGMKNTRLSLTLIHLVMMKWTDGIKVLKNGNLKIN